MGYLPVSVRCNTVAVGLGTWLVEGLPCFSTVSSPSPTPQHSPEGEEGRQCTEPTFKEKGVMVPLPLWTEYLRTLHGILK